MKNLRAVRPFKDRIAGRCGATVGRISPWYERQCMWPTATIRHSIGLCKFHATCADQVGWEPEPLAPTPAREGE